MRRATILALSVAALAAVPVTSAEASIVLVGTFSGNQCTGGDITTCYASGTTAGNGSLTQVGNGSPAAGSPGIASITHAGTSDDFNVSFSNGVLSFTYTPEAGDPAIHYFGVYQGGDGVTGVKNPYELFYSSDPLTMGSVTLSTYWKNSDDWSHIDFFDTGTPPVPEPATWAMMLLGFGGIGLAMRRKRTPVLAQVA